MIYKKVGLLLFLTSFTVQADQSINENNETSKNEEQEKQYKKTKADNQSSSEDINDVITVIASANKQNELKKINSVIAGRSTLSSGLIEQKQADNVAELLNTLPGVSSAGSVRPGGQTLNIWGFGKVEDVKIIVDGSQKGFQKY